MMDFKLTGSQGDVMKESMNVAKTMAWSLLTDKRKKELVKKFDDTKRGYSRSLSRRSYT